MSVTSLTAYICNNQTTIYHYNIANYYHVRNRIKLTWGPKWPTLGYEIVAQSQKDDLDETVRPMKEGYTHTSSIIY